MIKQASGRNTQHMKEPRKFMQSDLLINADVGSEDLFSHGLVSGALSPADPNDAAKISVVKYLKKSLHNVSLCVRAASLTTRSYPFVRCQFDVISQYSHLTSTAGFTRYTVHHRTTGTAPEP